MRFGRHIGLLLCLCMISLQTIADISSIEHRRALLIACDEFVTQDSMAPSALGTTQAMRRILSDDLRGYDKVTTIINQPLDKIGLQNSLHSAFEGATENDTSFIYISTHGEKMGADSWFSLLFSDGKIQHRVWGKDLLKYLSTIPGQKILFLDSCYSGSIIPKGGWQNKLRPVSIPNDIIILTSSGADELSYNWSGGSNNLLGGSYFTLALESALSASFHFQADENRNGVITLEECKRFLMDNLGPSSVQSFPENSDFVVVQAQNVPYIQSSLTGLSFDSRILTKESDSLYFSFILHQPANLSYLLVYRKEGQWLFDGAQVIHENIKSSPGYQERSLALENIPDIESGYAVLIIAERVDNGMAPLASTLLSVKMSCHEPIQLSTASIFNPIKGEELSISFTHERPCRYSLAIYDAQGSIVAQPVLHAISRPQTKFGTTVYWDGKDKNGYILGKGLYWAQVTVYEGNQVMTAFSSSFLLEESQDKTVEVLSTQRESP